MKPGATVRIDSEPQQAWLIEQIVYHDPDDPALPEYLKGTWQLDLVGETDTFNTIRRQVTTSTPSQVLTLLQTEGPHYPRCGDCGATWPCTDEMQARYARRQAVILIDQIEREAAYPYVCGWCERFTARRGRRFATARGRDQHANRHCRFHPARWNLHHAAPQFDNNGACTGWIMVSHTPSEQQQQVIAYAAYVRNQLLTSPESDPHPTSVNTFDTSNTSNTRSAGNAGR